MWWDFVVFFWGSNRSRCALKAFEQSQGFESRWGLLSLICATDVEPVSPLEADVMAAERRDWLAPGGVCGWWQVFTGCCSRFRPQEAVRRLLGLFCSGSRKPPERVEARLF